MHRNPHPRPLSPEYRGEGSQEFEREAACPILDAITGTDPHSSGWWLAGIAWSTMHDDENVRMTGTYVPSFLYICALKEISCSCR